MHLIELPTMDLRKLKTILDLFKNSNIQELEITEGEEKLRLLKDIPQASHALPVSPTAVPTTQAPLPAMPPSENVPEDDPNLVLVEAPMVGTYYAKPGAGDPPFVKVGEKVIEGDIVCIIEAMKLFNNVNAPVSGRVRSVDVENEQPVGFGELLMTIEKDG